MIGVASLVRRWVQGSGRNQAASRNRARIHIEHLEDRQVLDGGSFMAEPVLPVITEGMKQHLQAVYAQGLQRGNRPDVFAKVGDSMSWLSQYLNDLGSTYYNPSDPAVAGTYTFLAPVINFFRSQPLPGTVAFRTSPYQAAPLLPQTHGVNSFNRDRLATH